MSQRSLPRSKIGRVRAAATAAVLMLSIASCSSAALSEMSVPPLSVDRSALDARASGAPALQIVAPEPGSRVTSPVEITIAVENYSLAAKGVSKDGEGHFHVVKDACIEPGEVIGDSHTHVGSGAATVSIELEPGRHELCLQLGDGFHTALAITEMLQVEVVTSAVEPAESAQG